MTTKDRIIYEALMLFSINGYEAVSTRMIAKAVSVTDSAMYKHFRSKQDLLDAILTECQSRFMKKLEETDFMEMEWGNLEEVCMSFFQFQTEDPWIVAFRKLLMVEQFKDPQMQQLYRNFFIEIPIAGQKKIFERLIEENILKPVEPEIMAMELYAPFFMYHTLEQEKSVQDRLKKHVKEFIMHYAVEQLGGC